MSKICIFLFFLSTVISANNKPTIEDRKIIELSLDYKFDEAEKLLDDIHGTNKNLKYYYLNLNIELVKSIQAAENVPFNRRREVKDSLNQILINYSEKVVDQYEDEDSLTIDEKFYLGSIYGLLGRAYGVQRSWMSAFSNGKEGYDILEDVVEEDPNYTDAYLLLGMMNYYTDRLGGITEFIAGILGLSGERKVGLNYLKNVEQNGTLNKWQATMILIELYSRLENNKFASIPLLEKMVYNFPNNTQFINWYCYDLLNLDKLNQVQKIIENPKYKINDFIKATYYHLAGDYEESNYIINNLVSKNNFPYPRMKENAEFIRIINFFMLGKSDKIAQLKSDLSENYLTEINDLLKNPDLSKKLLNFKKAVSFNEISEIEKFKNNPPDFTGSKYAESYYLFYNAVHEFKQNNIKQAAEDFEKSKSINFKNYGYSASRYLIQIYKTINISKEKVEKLLDDIDDLDSDSLEFSAQDLEDKYNL